METLVKFANDFWNLWLGMLFVGLVIYTCWPSKARRNEMSDAANIPFADDKTDHVKGA